MLLTRAFHYRPACWAHARRASCHKAKFFKIWAFWAGARHQHLNQVSGPGNHEEEMAKKGLFLLPKSEFWPIFRKKLMDEAFASSADIGKAGEDQALLYLKRAGYRILDRNYANGKGIRLGEIDIIAEKEEEIVFVEVKAAFIDTGRSERLPEWQITPAKLRKMEKAAVLYLKEKGLLGREYSFDAVSVMFFPGKEPEIRHLDHIFYT